MSRGRLSAAAVERRRIRTPVLVTTAVAWVGLAVGSFAGGAHAGGAGHLHGGEHAHHRMGAAAATSGGLWRHGGPLTTGLMVVAMMAPLTIAPLRLVVERSVRSRRVATGAAFLAGYAAVWSVAAWVLERVGSLIERSGAPASVTLSAGLGLLLVWQATPWKQRCLLRTHAHHTIVPRATRGAAGATTAGATHAVWCAASCAAIMVLPAVAGHAWWAMVGATVWLWAERYERPRRPRWGIVVPTRAARAAAFHLRGRVRPSALVALRTR